MDELPARSAAVLRGTILRAWRERAGLSQQDVGTAVNLSSQAVSMWESGQRGIAPGTATGPLFETWDRVLDGGPCLTDLLRAAGTRAGLRARSTWSHNFHDATGGPVWIWLRAESETQVATFSWGPTIRGSCSVSPGAGRIVSFPASAHTPPLHVAMGDGLGWVDFGRGEVPDHVARGLSLSTVSATRLLEARPAGSKHAIAGRVVKKLSPLACDFIEEFDERHELPPGLVRATLRQFRPDASPITDNTPLLPGDELAQIDVDAAGSVVSQWRMSPEEVRQLRQARGLSRADVMREMTALEPRMQVPRTFLLRADGGRSGDRGTGYMARLDHVLHAGGELGVRRLTEADDVPTEITFPEFWVGPVWVQLIAPTPSASATIDMLWGPWHRPQAGVRHSTVLSTRKDLPEAGPLVVQAPSGWRVSAGTGSLPGAIDANSGWRPRNLVSVVRVVERHLDQARRAREEPDTGRSPGAG